MKALLVWFALAASAFGGDLNARFQTALLDVHTDSTEYREPDLPGMGKSEYVVSISIQTNDFSASEFCVTAQVRLEDGTLAGVSKCVDKDPFDKPVSLRFSTGSVRPTAWVKLFIVRMHAEPADRLVTTPRP